MYFIDDLNGGNVYKYTSAANSRKVMSGRADYFAAGQAFVLRVGEGNTPNATGAYTWVPFFWTTRIRMMTTMTTMTTMTMTMTIKKMTPVEAGTTGTHG